MAFIFISAFLAWGIVERWTTYSDTPVTFLLAAVCAAGRLCSVLINVLTGGKPHEPFSARAGRRSWFCKWWARIAAIIDIMFFDPAHSRDAFIRAHNRANYKYRHPLEWVWHDR